MASPNIENFSKLVHDSRKVSEQDSRHKLFNAIEENRLDLFKLAYDEKYSDADIKKALKKAVARNNFEIIKMIVKPPNYRWFQYTSMLTVKYNNLSLFKSMCEMESVDMEEALKAAVYFNNMEFINYLLTLENPSLDSGFSMAICCNNKRLVDLFHDRIKASNIKYCYKHDITNLIDQQNIEMLEYLISLGVSSWKDIRERVRDRTDVPIVKAFLDKIDPVNKETMLTNLMKEENIDKLEQLVSKSIATNLGLAFLAETLGKDKIAKYFVLKCHLEHLTELQNNIANKKQ